LTGRDRAKRAAAVSSFASDLACAWRCRCGAFGEGWGVGRESKTYSQTLRRTGECGWIFSWRARVAAMGSRWLLRVAMLARHEHYITEMRVSAWLACEGKVRTQQAGGHGQRLFDWRCAAGLAYGITAGQSQGFCPRALARAFGYPQKLSLFRRLRLRFARSASELRSSVHRALRRISLRCGCFNGA